MSGPAKFDFASVSAHAQKLAADNETQSAELLWGHVISRASQDESFRRNLANNPEQTLTREAETLNISVAPEQLHAAKALFSPAVPGIDRAKVEALIFSTIEDVRKSFNMTLQLSRFLFYTGVLLLLMSAVFTWTKGAAAGSIFGAAGALSLVTSLIRSPLDRIRNAGANLVQLQMAYLAYYNLLYLLGSRGERLAFADAQKYAEEFRQTATVMVSAVQSIIPVELPVKERPQTGVSLSEKRIAAQKTRRGSSSENTEHTKASSPTATVPANERTSQ